MAARPSSDQAVTDARWYELLSDAQSYYYTQFAIHCPYVLIGAPTQLTAAADNKTYSFASSVRPLYVELYDGENGVKLTPSAYDDVNGDYVWEGSRARMPGNAARTFSNGLWGRYVSPPTVINATTAPTLVPDYARLLLVYHGASEFARQGGLRDSAPYEAKLRQLEWGAAGTGDTGILGTLKLANPDYGATAYRRPFFGTSIRWVAGLNPI